MDVTVSTRNTVLAEHDRGLVIEKLTRLGSKFLAMDRAEAHFFEEKNPRIHDREVCEVTLEGHGHHVRCKAAGPDHLTAIDRAVEKLENKLHKLKTKLSAHRTHRDRGKAKAWVVDEPLPQVRDVEAVEDEAPTTEESTPKIVKTKTVERLVLFPEDAAQRMELVEHDFYFFTNRETGRSAVVYRRVDGHVGLIDEGE